MLGSTVVNFMVSTSFGKMICPELSGKDAGLFPMIEARNTKSQVRYNSIEGGPIRVGRDLFPVATISFRSALAAKIRFNPPTFFQERRRNPNVWDFRSARLCFKIGKDTLQATRDLRRSRAGARFGSAIW